MLENLFELLETALADKVKAKTSLPNDIGRLINKHFKSRENLMKVDSMLKGRTIEVDSERKDFKGFVEYVPGMTVKKANIVSSPEAVVDNPTPDENESSEELYDEFVLALSTDGVVPQTLLDKFGTVDQIKTMCKSSGFELDYSLEGVEFLQLLIDVVGNA